MPSVRITGRRRVALPFVILAAAVALILPGSARGQAIADAVLVGQVLLGDTILTSGTVVLHQIGPDTQGEIDSVAVAPDGSFVMRLPRVPDPQTQEMYFAAVRHDGVMYFGNAITAPVDLDSLYVIHAYDTLIAPAEGVPVVLESRSIFMEQSDVAWVVTDVFQLHNEMSRTVVPREGGRVWSYPLPAGAREVSAEGEMSQGVIGYEGGDIVFRAPLPPGERLFVIRYTVDSLTTTFPTPGGMEMLDVLVREPAPMIEIEGLGQDEPIQLEAGSTYRRFAGQNVSLAQVRIQMAEEVAPPPVEWIAVLLALVLAGGALVALRGGSRAAAGRATATAAPQGRAGGGASGRERLLTEIARLDEAYESEPSPSEPRTKEYRRRRAELMERLRSQG